MLDLTTDQDIRFDDVKISPAEYGLRFDGRLSFGGGALTEGVSFNVTFRALEVVDLPPRDDRGDGT